MQIPTFFYHESKWFRHLVIEFIFRQIQDFYPSMNSYLLKQSFAHPITQYISLQIQIN